MTNPIYRRRTAEKPKKPSLADRQQAEWTAAAAKEVIDYLRSATESDKTRQIRDLKKHEIDALAIAVVSEYVKVRQKQADDEALKRMLGEELDDSIDDIGFI